MLVRIINDDEAMTTASTLRNILVTMTIALSIPAFAGTPVSDPVKKEVKPAPEQAQRTGRKQVASFQDPTQPLAELVERIRRERAK